jgi:hypothetical protein
MPLFGVLVPEQELFFGFRFAVSFRVVFLIDLGVSFSIFFRSRLGCGRYGNHAFTVLELFAETFV